jgi:hypothetical protein
MAMAASLDTVSGIRYHLKRTKKGVKYGVKYKTKNQLGDHVDKPTK